jgi:hypothetical protein
MVLALTPFISLLMRLETPDEMAQGIWPWTMSDARYIVEYYCGSWSTLTPRYLRSPRRAIVVRYRSTSLLAK